MDAKQQNSHNMMIRAAKFLEVHSAILNAAAQAIVPQLTTSITAIDALRMSQVAGNGQLGGGVTERRVIARELRQMLVDIAKTARVLAKADHPGLDDELRVPRTSQYSALLGAGDAFVAKLSETGIATLFITRGFDETFVEDLAAKVEDFREATERKFAGLNEQLAGTAGLIAKTRAGVAVVRDLDAILTPQLRKTDAGLFGAWKSAIHIQRPPKSKKKGEQPAPEMQVQPLALAAAGGGETQSATVEVVEPAGMTAMNPEEAAA